jgi:hypothetical protein
MSNQGMEGRRTKDEVASPAREREHEHEHEQAASQSQPPSQTPTAIESAKFNLGLPPRAPEERAFDKVDIPWGYGDTRITALVRSPDSLYVFWEITDPAIEDARRRLGDAGAWAFCNVRVYDTTGREFDGTNANDYFDVPVDRGERERFFLLRRPTAQFHVEIGMKSHEGYFQPIARSGRADFPRKSPSPDHSLEWMTVMSDVLPPAARPYVSKYTGPPPRTPSLAPPHHEHGHGHGEGKRESVRPISGGALGEWRESRTWTWTHPASFEVRWEGPWVWDEWRTEWRTRWLESLAFRAGPFPLEHLDPSRVEIRWVGGAPSVTWEEASGLEVVGPWQVTIRSFDQEPQRRVLGTWRVHWATVSPRKVERWWSAFERRQVGTYYREHVRQGASEAHLTIEAGASEIWRLGASERMWLGGSEWLAQGGSEVLWLGGSEMLFGGASAFLFGGASGIVWGGGSEQRLGGASETLFMGSSALSWEGASGSGFPGASENAWLGASDHHYPR